MSVVDRAHAITDVIPVFKQLSQDDTQDSIRV